MEPRFRPDRKAIREPVIGNAHRARGEAVHRVGLIVGPRHQGREGALHALRRVAAQDVALQRIERQRVLIVDRARPDLREHAAFRGLRVDVVEVREVFRIFQLAERGHAMPFGVVCGLRRLRQRFESRRAGGKGASADAENAAARQSAHERDPAFPALAPSHHHTVGKPEKPYFGSGSGRPKRSQRALRTLP
jgi:hypothetical protein